MNCVGIDVSKGKSMITVMRPGKEVVIEPFEVSHTDSELIDLAKVIQSLDGETRVVMEATGNYHLPIRHRKGLSGCFRRRVTNSYIRWIAAVSKTKRRAAWLRYAFFAKNIFKFSQFKT